MSILVWSIVVFLALAWLAYFLKQPGVKGSLGEWRVRLLALHGLDSKVYYGLHNVTLPTLKGTTQIDHLFVSRYGIFVLETKNMRGWISGGEQDRHWTQQFHRRSFTFQNPLRQNYRHLKALETLLGIEPGHMHSVIVFAGGGTFKTPMPANVTQGAGFVRYIRSFRDPVFTEGEAAMLFDILQRIRLAPTRATHREHVQQLQRRHEPTMGKRRCTACGSEMVLRTAKVGSRIGQYFWGCSSFPRCRTTQAL